MRNRRCHRVTAFLGRMESVLTHGGAPLPASFLTINWSYIYQQNSQNIFGKPRAVIASGVLDIILCIWIFFPLFYLTQNRKKNICLNLWLEVRMDQLAIGYLVHLNSGHGGVASIWWPALSLSVSKPRHLVTPGWCPCQPQPPALDCWVLSSPPWAMPCKWGLWGNEGNSGRRRSFGGIS